MMFQRELLDNISKDPVSEYAQVEKNKIDIILTNVLKKAGIGIKGQERIMEHKDRSAFLSFIRVAQFDLFNPDRPRITGNIYICIFSSFF